jgi:hypothetical protein
MFFTIKNAWSRNGHTRTHPLYKLKKTSFRAMMSGHVCSKPRWIGTIWNHPPSITRPGGPAQQYNTMIIIYIEITMYFYTLFCRYVLFFVSCVMFNNNWIIHEPIWSHDIFYYYIFFYNTVYLQKHIFLRY